MTEVCLHLRIIHSSVGDRCADCSEVLTVTEHSIRDCSHPIWRIMPPPYPDRFPCPQCGEWVQVEAVLAGG